jgi:hypothetical protein
MIGHCKRHPMKLKAKWGAKSDGTRCWPPRWKSSLMAGAYMYTTNKVLGNTVMTCHRPV